MGIRGTQNSHIQIPKSFLKKFSTSKDFINERGLPEKHKFTYRLNRQGDIEEQKIEKANTEFGYFEEEVETEFGKIESDFISARDNIIAFVNQAKSKNCTKFDEKDIQAVKRFCALCLIRSPLMAKGVSEKSLFVRLGLVANEPQNVVAMEHLNNLDEADRLFDGLEFTIVENESNINIILPQIAVYSMMFDDGLKNIYLPVTPKVLFLFTSETVYKNGALHIFYANDKDIDALNKYAILSECRNNVGNIYGKFEQDLEKYKEFIISWGNYEIQV